MSEFIEKIRQLNENYSNIRLERAVYRRKSGELDLNFLMSVHFDESDKEFIKDFVLKNLPDIKVNVDIKKVVCDCKIAKKRILDFISAECLSVKGRISGDDVDIKLYDNKVKVVFKFEKSVCSYLENSNFMGLLENHLKSCFCETFSFEFCPCEQNKNNSVLKEEKVDYKRIETIPARYFKVNYVTRLFDNNPTDEVMYIQDAIERTGEIAIAGKIIQIREKTARNGKPFYILDFNDGTGRMSGTVFTTKEIIRKMEKLQEGCEVVAVGKAEISGDGYHRFTISSINYCELPKDFVYQPRASRGVPDTYLKVGPTPIEEMRQTDMFNAVFVPDCLKGKNIVVFDFETTGTMPQDDRVTEIGAVRILDGKITEKFATMVNPERRIPPNVVEITGITDDMVADAPKFSEVAGDFYKFCDGAILVAHNITFDYAFLRNMSRPSNYEYNNRGIDTLSFSRAILPQLGNHKLNTVCDYFGIEFLHHRAYNDALATAQMFIELVKLNGGLPDYDI